MLKILLFIISQQEEREEKGNLLKLVLILISFSSLGALEVSTAAIQTNQPLFLAVFRSSSRVASSAVYDTFSCLNKLQRKEGKMEERRGKKGTCGQEIEL